MSRLEELRQRESELQDMLDTLASPGDTLMKKLTWAAGQAHPATRSGFRSSFRKQLREIRKEIREIERTR